MHLFIILSSVACIAGLVCFIYLTVLIAKRPSNNMTNVNSLDRALYYHTQIQATSDEGDLEQTQNHLEPLVPVKVYYINMDRSSKRKDQFEEQAVDLGMNFQRVSGVDGKKIKTQYNLRFGVAGGMEYQNDFLTNFSFSELGCTLSHIKAIRTAYDNGDQVALICEDDISFEMSKLWPSGLFRKLIQDMNTATGIIQLCWNSSMRSDTNNKYCAYGDSYGVTPLPSDVWCWSAVAYLISRKGMHDVLAHSEYLIGTKVHLKKTPQIQDGYADEYIYTKRLL